MKRIITYLTVTIFLLQAIGCKKIDQQFENIYDRIDKIEGTSLTTIDQQIDAINGSIDDLKKVDAELKGYIESLQNTASDLQSKIDATNDALATLESDLEGQITASEQKVLDELKTVKTALEGQLATINNTIAALQAKDAELDQKIADLQKYVDNEITATEDWASATFSTLEQYEATQTAISDINALIKSTQESVTALEEKLGKKITDDIAAAVAGVNADIAAKVTEITDAYTAAIATAKADITAAYTDAIKTAITASETSMKEWVNGVLADGYYTKAEIDGKITALQTQVTEGDAALQKEIDELKASLAKAESDLTAAYKKAIEDAITDNNGKISAEIAAAVKAAQDNLQAQIDTINSEIEKINARLYIIEADINSINQQIDAINGSIDDLKKVDAELKGYIESLQNTANDLQSKIDATNAALAALESDLEGQITASEQKVLDELKTVKTALEGQLATINNTIAALQAKDAELDQKIADLQKYVDNEITATEDWASATFSTLEQYEATQTAISDINALIKSTQESVTALEEKLGKKITDDIAAAVAGVNADIAAKVTEITDAYTAAIATAKADITAAYTDAIKTAITASETSMKEWVNGVLADGYYTKAEIDGKITALQTQVTEGDAALQKEIDELKASLAKAESDLTAAYKKAIEDAITDNNGKISAEIAAAVKAAQDNLQAQIDTINSEIEKINARLYIIEADINSINQQIDAINGSIDDLKKVDAELKGYIESLQNTANDLQSKIDATNAALAALESDLEGQITASEQKVLDELKTVKTALEGQLATIKETITTLTSRLTIIEGKIVQLFNAIDECATQEDVNEVKQNLATVQSDMAAMKDAIEDLQGRMDTVEGEVDLLQTAVDELESRIEALEELFDQIQSVTFIPQYSDGKVKLDYTAHTVSLDFMINPQRLNTALVKAWENNKGTENSVIKAYVRYTNDPTTRAGGTPTELTVTAVTASEDGMINITVKDNDPSLLIEDFWKGNKEAVIYIVITNGRTEIASDAIPMIAHNYVGNTNSIGGFGDGDSYQGNAGE